MTELNEKKILAQHEYGDISANLHHYLNVQLAQLTVFFAINAGLVWNVATSQSGSITLTSLGLRLAGLALSIFFLALNSRIVEYWDDRASRARELEGILGYVQYKRTPPKKFLTRFINNAVGVALCYMIVGAFWLVGMVGNLVERADLRPWLFVSIFVLVVYFGFCFQVYRRELKKR